MINLCLVNSYIGCGKDTFSEMLKIEFLKLKRKTNLIRLAGPGYEIAEKYLGSSEREYVKGILEGLRTVIDDNIWINYGLSQMEEEKTNIIIDVRQTNELLTSIGNGYLPIVLEITKERSKELQKMRFVEYGKTIVEDEDFYNLASEVGAYEVCKNGDIGVMISNDDTLDALQLKAKSLVLAIHFYELAELLGAVSVFGLVDESNENLVVSYLKQIESFYGKKIVYSGGLVIKEKLTNR